VGKRTILYLLIFFVVLCSTWQDFFLVNIFGEIFRTPMLLLLPIIVLSEYGLRGLKKHERFSKVNRFFLNFHLLYIASTIVILIFWAFNDGRSNILGENIIVKCIKALSYFSLLWLVFRLFYFLLIKSYKYNLKVDLVFIWLILFYILIIFVELLSPNTLHIFHSSSEPYNRIRLLTAESSWTGGIALLLITGLFYNNPSRFKYWIAAIFILVFTVTSGSKQFLLGLIISFLFISFKQLKKNFFVSFVLISAFIVFSYFLILPYLIGSIGSDIEAYTSTATRGLSFYTSMKFLYAFPIGTGGMYFHYFNQEIKNGADSLSKVFPSLNFSEVLEWGAGNSAKSVSPKSTLSYMIVVLGIPGLFLIINFYRSLIRIVKGNPILLMLVIYFIITTIFLEPIEGKPNLSIFLALLCFTGDFKIKAGPSNHENKD
jgi:hypothetical protein